MVIKSESNPRTPLDLDKSIFSKEINSDNGIIVNRPNFSFLDNATNLSIEATSSTIIEFNHRLPEARTAFSYFLS